jgi:uncharacterized protein (TIGR00661 family)
MKILYAIQGTGNGHITVAREVLPLLLQKAEVDVLVSGTQVDIDLPYPVKYRLKGLCFVFGKKGGIDYLETFKRSRIKRLFREIKELPVEQYDLVLSDFEPVSAWSCRLKGKPCIGFSHQAAVINKQTPRPKKADMIGKAVLKHYAPVSKRYGFHFLPYDKNIFTPVIRSEIRNKTITNDGHYTVYLPAFSDKRIIKMLSRFPAVQWQVFSKHTITAYTAENISIRTIENEAFINSIVSAAGVLCGAGFQTPAEVLHLKKKLMVLPMKGQYEQQCNAVALQLLGVPVIKNLKRKQEERIKEWLEGDKKVIMDYPDETQVVLEEIIERHAQSSALQLPMDERISTASRFRNYLLKKIFYQFGA